MNPQNNLSISDVASSLFGAGLVLIGTGITQVSIQLYIGVGLVLLGVALKTLVSVLTKNGYVISAVPTPTVPVDAVEQG